MSRAGVHGEGVWTPATAGLRTKGLGTVWFDDPKDLIGLVEGRATAAADVAWPRQTTR